MRIETYPPNYDPLKWAKYPPQVRARLAIAEAEIAVYVPAARRRTDIQFDCDREAESGWAWPPVSGAR